MMNTTIQHSHSVESLPDNVRSVGSILAYRRNSNTRLFTWTILLSAISYSFSFCRLDLVNILSVDLSHCFHTLLKSGIRVFWRLRLFYIAFYSLIHVGTHFGKTNSLRKAHQEVLSFNIAEHQPHCPSSLQRWS